MAGGFPGARGERSNGSEHDAQQNRPITGPTAQASVRHEASHFGGNGEVSSAPAASWPAVQGGSMSNVCALLVRSLFAARQRGNVRVRTAQRQRALLVMTDNPQALVIDDVNELAAVVGGYAGDVLESLQHHRMLRIAHVHQAN